MPDANVATDMQCAVCRNIISKAISYEGGGRSTKALWNARHADLDGHHRPSVAAMKYSQVFSVKKGTSDERVVGLKTYDAAADATANNVDWIAREGVMTISISRGEAGEHVGIAGCFVHQNQLP